MKLHVHVAFCCSSLKMDLPSYVAYRMYCDINEIPIRHHKTYEGVFQLLGNFTSAYTRQYGSHMFPKIPGNRTSIDEVLMDTTEIFKGILTTLGSVDNPLVIKTLFVASYYMMVKYKSAPSICGNISFWFDTLSHKSKGWNILLDTLHNP